jgi:hypothetical protein
MVFITKCLLQEDRKEDRQDQPRLDYFLAAVLVVTATEEYTCEQHQELKR